MLWKLWWWLKCNFRKYPDNSNLAYYWNPARMKYARIVFTVFHRHLGSVRFAINLLKIRTIYLSNNFNKITNHSQRRLNFIWSTMISSDRISKFSMKIWLKHRMNCWTILKRLFQELNRSKGMYLKNVGLFMTKYKKKFKI